MTVDEMIDYLLNREDDSDPSGELACIRMKLRAAEELADTLAKVLPAYSSDKTTPLHVAYENYRKGVPSL